MSRTREDRVNDVMIGALEGTELAGDVLFTGGSEATRQALEDAGLQVVAWKRFGAGATVLPPEQRVDRVCLRLPKGRRNLLAMLHVVAKRLKPDGRLWLHGANDEGIKSARKTLADVFGQVESVDARRHGRLWSGASVRVELQDLWSFATHFEVEVAGRTLNLTTLPGVFADGRVDDGTRLLLANLDVEKGASVLDFGSGAGVIGAWLADRTETIRGYDLDAWAVACAERNAPGTYTACDGWSNVEGAYDHIVSNPPFHTGKDTDFRIIDDLVGGAREKLRRKGRLTFVCPSTAPVHEALRKHFKSVRMLADDRRYKVWDAS